MMYKHDPLTIMKLNTKAQQRLILGRNLFVILLTRSMQPVNQVATSLYILLV